MATHDLVIRGGGVIDGSGAAAKTADVAIDGGTIVEVGKVDARGASEIDASGAAAGLQDRGQLLPGLRADVNVIDFENLSALRPEIHHDLPAGGRRLLQRAIGYLHTICAGQEIYQNGVATGALPGRLIRHAG